MEIEVIFYVKDLAKSKEFYASVFEISPTLDVQGMVEFSLASGFKLGLMPEAGIAKIICPIMPNPALGNGIPRSELYIKHNNHLKYFNNAIKNKAIIISEPAARDWGDTVSYVADLDGHIIALAN